MSLGFEVKYDGQDLMVNGHNMKDETATRVFAEGLVPMTVGSVIRGIVFSLHNWFDQDSCVRRSRFVDQISYQMGDLAGSIAVDAYYNDMTRQKNYKKLGAAIGAVVGSTFEDSKSVKNFIPSPSSLGSNIGGSAASWMLNDMYAAKLHAARGFGQQAGLYIGLKVEPWLPQLSSSNSQLRIQISGVFGANIVAACVAPNKKTRDFYLRQAVFDGIIPNRTLSRMALSKYYRYYRLL